jgi:hypothetical protein
MNIFEEYTWLQFTRLDYIRKLPLNEQVQKYNQYLYELSEARHSFISYQNKGPRRTTPTPPVEDGFLLQEDLFDLLQETGDKIIITT